MTVLRQFGGVGGHFMQDAASSCNRAFQPVYEHRRCMRTHALTILFLPGLVGQLLGGDGRATGDDLMHKVPMQALAMRGELAFLSRESSTPDLIAPAVSPTQMALLHTPLVIVVLLIIGASLAIKFALETALLLRV